MKGVILLVIFTILPAYVFAQASAKADKKQPPGKQGVEQTIMQLDRELMDAAVKNDDAVMNRIELADYVFINPGGGVESGRPTGAAPKFDSFDRDNVVVHVSGDTAVLTGRAVVKGRLANGTDISGPYRYMRVFVKQKGQWRLAATSAVPINPLPATKPATPKT